jgi:sulfotransferase famil protein
LPDFVGRFENLSEDFARVASSIGAPHLRFPHLTPARSRESRHYRDFYDEELTQMVGERYRKDTELFEYSF